jgi:Fungal tRNA ligase phosphodiesterase domain
LDDLEIRLRDVLDRYEDVILSSTVDVATSRQTFITSLKEKICEADSIVSYDVPPFVKIAAIDVAVVSVLHVLREVYKNERISTFFDRILCGNDIDEILSDLTYRKAEDLGFVTKSHVTLAHCRSMSQSCLRSTFTPHLESTMELSAHSLLWNDRVMALAVKVSEITSEGKILPSSINEFVHLTVWIDKDASAVEANNLPRLVDMGEAYRLDFPSYSLQGVVSLWNM